MLKNKISVSRINRTAILIGIISSILIYSFTENISFSIINFVATLIGVAGFKMIVFSIDKYIIEKSRKSGYYFLSLLKMIIISTGFALSAHFVPGSSLFYIIGIIIIFLSILAEAVVQFIRR